MTFSVSLQLRGGFWSEEATPFRSGPRHHGQSLLLDVRFTAAADWPGSLASVIDVTIAEHIQNTATMFERGMNSESFFYYFCLFSVGIRPFADVGHILPLQAMSDGIQFQSERVRSNSMTPDYREPK